MKRINGILLVLSLLAISCSSKGIKKQTNNKPEKESEISKENSGNNVLDQVSKVVDKFTKLEADAESVFLILKSVKSEMSRIKSNFLNRASAAELNADSSHLIKGVNRAIEMLNDIDYFIEQYQTEGGWQHFFGGNKVMTGGATPLENMIDIVFGTKNTQGG